MQLLVPREAVPLLQTGGLELRRVSIPSAVRHSSELTGLRLQNATWRDKYVAGLISWSGSFGGRGSNYANLFSGLNLADGSYDPSSASAWASFPGTFLGAAAPDTGDGTPVIATSGSGGCLCQHTCWLVQGLQLMHSLSSTAPPWLHVQMLGIIHLPTWHGPRACFCILRPKLPRGNQSSLVCCTSIPGRERLILREALGPLVN